MLLLLKPLRSHRWFGATTALASRCYRARRHRAAPPSAFKHTQDLVMPLPSPLPVSLQPAPLSTTTSCEFAPLPDSPELSPRSEDTYDEWSINAFQRCRQMAADARSSCSTSVVPVQKELVDTEQSYKCKFANATVAVTTDGKPLARERSVDRSCDVSCRVPSNVICADLSSSSELICYEIKHCLFHVRFHHRRASYV